jgi:penicillin G amidase
MKWVRVICGLGAVAACTQVPPPPAPIVAQVDGTIDVAGLIAPVRIVRDHWGVPHIYAQNQDDLFMAQGFVQAQDRLFQMDLWRRTVQGRLSEVLGANFIERDAMTRRFQYRGDLDAEWASYGPDTQAIAGAFVRGINAWVARALERPPEEFVRAGWKPAFWQPTDVLNRTDAFVASGDAIEEVRRSKLHGVVADAVRRVGTPPFFATMTPPVDAGQTAARAFDSATAATGAALAVSEVRGKLQHPSARYFVHLKAPGWNVIGVTSPWLPGVAAGHNDRMAWAMVPIAVDTQDFSVQPLTAPKTVVQDPVTVKGRRDPFVADTEITSAGVVVAVDRARNIAYTLRWSGTEPGCAAELTALALDRAQTWKDFRAALVRWKMPARRAVYVDVDGNVGFQDVAFMPRRRGRTWSGWLTVDELPHAFNPPGKIVAVHPSSTGLPPVSHEAVFAHVLGASIAGRQRFNIGPLSRPPDDDSPIRAILDPREWDRSRAINAPGQSESPDSAHFADLAKLWSAGESFPLVFSDAAVLENTKTTLMLMPRPGQP